MFIEKSLLYKLHSALKITPLWPDFLSAIAEEMELQKLEDDKTKDFNNVYNLDIEGLLKLCEKFGYFPNRILDSSLDFLRLEALSIPYRIRNKSTTNGYLFNFKIIKKEGKVYNYFYSDPKLFLAIDWINTENILDSTSDLTKPFTQLLPNVISNLVTDTIINYLDLDFDLDNDPLIYLDGFSETFATKHLGIFYDCYELHTKNTEEYIYYDDYFKYLEQGCLYNKRLAITPHVGCSLNILTDNSGFYNSFDTNLEYTTPDIKLKSVITSFFNESTLLDEEFLYLYAGEGTLYSPSNTTHNIFSTNLIFYYTLDDNDLIDTLFDMSNNAYNLTIIGNTKKQQGIIGKTLLFDGNNYATSNDSIVLSLSSYTLSFWFNPSSYAGIVTILQLGLLKLQYNYTTSLFIVDFNSSITTYTIDLENFIQIEITSNSLNIFNNTILLDTIDITSIDYSGSHTLYLGVNDSLTQNFIGILDDVSLVNKIFTSDEKDTIYINKIGLIQKLEKELIKVPLSVPDIYDGIHWLGFNSYIPANSLEEDIIKYNTTTNTYEGTLLKSNIKPGSCFLKFKRIINNVETESILQDNSNGKFEDDTLYGEIDYTNGKYLITDFTTIEVPILSIYNGVGVTTIGASLQNNIVPLTFKLYYKISGTNYIATDNGGGLISGTGISSGNIDYNLGTFNVIFSQKTTDNESILCAYDYKNQTIINDGSIFTLTYKINTKIAITELGLGNKEHLFTYATFPPIEFDNALQNINSTFFIKKS